MSDFSGAEVHDINPFSSSAPVSGLTVSQVSGALESLPITDGGCLISLHFTPPSSQVVSAGSETMDIETLEDEDLSYDLEMKIAQVSKISISYNIQKVEDMEAAQFMKLVKMYLDDTDMMLL